MTSHNKFTLLDKAMTSQLFFLNILEIFSCANFSIITHIINLTTKQFMIEHLNYLDVVTNMLRDDII